jgi:hypothetical protein
MTRTTMKTTNKPGCTCAIPCQPTAPDQERTTRTACAGPVFLHDPSIATVDADGITHLPLRPLDVGYWERCGIEL